MILFFLSNLIFLASFVWLMLSGAGLVMWVGWVVAWFAVDFAVMWITGYEPPNWIWGAILALLGGLWVMLGAGYVA